MKWKSVKFWCWLEVGFPEELVSAEEAENMSLMSLYPELEREILYGAGAQGPQAVCEEDPGIPVCFDLLSFQSEFELNGIPSANVSVALGRRADDVTRAAEIHYYIDRLQLQLPATVWCLARTVDGSDFTESEWPAEKFRVFVGNLTGSGFSRNSGGAEFHLSLTHWLASLSFSSALSKQSHPLNPAQLTFQTSFVLDAALSGGSFIGDTGPFSTGPHLAYRFFSDPLVTMTDFWGGTNTFTGAGSRVQNGLKAWLLYLTKMDRINSAQIKLQVGSDLSAAINKEACRALLRFEPNAVGPDFDEEGINGTGYKLGVQVGLPTHPGLNTFIANSIAQAIGKEGLAGSQNVTLWDKLAGQFHSDYMYSVVPLVEKALVVPFVPGLSSGSDDTTLVHRIIRTSQYDSLDIQSVIPRPLRAVGVIMGKHLEAGTGDPGNQSAPYGSFGGWFDKWGAACTASGGEAPDCDMRYKEGLVMFKQAPKWMTNFVGPHHFSPASTGVTTNGIQTTNATTSGSPNATDPPRTIHINSRPIWNQYARTLYIHEVLKNRQGMLNGPVRFDIAPGSQIMIEAAEDKYVKEILYDLPDIITSCEEFSTWYWASVLRVSTVIDCQNAKAFTSYYIAHVRTAEENNDSGTSIPHHPVWQRSQWAGCVMVQNDVFGEQATKVDG